MTAAVAAPPAADIDAAAAVTVYRLVRDKPEEHDPSVWGYEGPSGSGYCFAGTATVWASVIAGDETAWRTGGANQLPYRELTGARTKAGRFVAVFEYARVALGLDVTRAEVLFFRDNTLDDIRCLIMAWAGVDPDTADISALAAATS